MTDSRKFSWECWPVKIAECKPPALVCTEPGLAVSAPSSVSLCCIPQALTILEKDWVCVPPSVECALWLACKDTVGLYWLSQPSPGVLVCVQSSRGTSPGVQSCLIHLLFPSQSFPPCHQSVCWSSHKELHGPGKLWASGKHSPIWKAFS